MEIYTTLLWLCMVGGALIAVLGATLLLVRILEWMISELVVRVDTVLRIAEYFRHRQSFHAWRAECRRVRARQREQRRGHVTDKT